MRFLIRRLKFRQLRNFFMRAIPLDRPDEDDQAEPDALEIKIRVAPATLSVLDEIKRKAVDPSRSATIQRLIHNQAENDSKLRSDESDDVSRAKTNGKPLASATFYYVRDGISRPLDVELDKDETAFCLRLHDHHPEVSDRLFSFADFSELARLLDRANDPRIGSREARLILELLSESDWLRQNLAVPTLTHDV